jgi:hypothetical protein
MENYYPAQMITAAFMTNSTSTNLPESLSPLSTILSNK